MQGKAIHIMPDDSDDIDVATEKVAKHIKAEIDNTEIHTEKYHIHINKDLCSRFQSDTLSDLLSKVSKKLS